MSSQRKSQVSVEYMMVIGFATVMTIPLLVIYYTYSSDTRDSVATTQALQIARRIADASESVYYLGKPSQTTLKLNFPDRIDSTNLSNREVVLRMKVENGLTDVVEISAINMTGTLPKTQGIHIVTIKANDGFVEITSN